MAQIKVNANMRKFSLLILLIGFLLIPFSLALDGCGQEVDPNIACMILTPPISCVSPTYDLYNSTLQLRIDDGTMSEIVSGSGVYNFSFNQPDLGPHSIILCDNTSSIINVETTEDTDFFNTNNNFTDLRNRIIEINNTKASIGNISTILGNISASQSGIISRGDIAWITATGFETETSALTRFNSLSAGIQTNTSFIIVELRGMNQTILNNVSNVQANLNTIFASLSAGIQNNATNVTNSVRANITQAVTSIITTGNSNWVTATGYETEVSASSRFDSLSSGIQANETAILLDLRNMNMTILNNVSRAQASLQAQETSEFSSLSAGIQNNATDIKINVTNTDYGFKIWNYAGTLLDSILRQFQSKLLSSTIHLSGKTLNQTLGETWNSSTSGSSSAAITSSDKEDIADRIMRRPVMPGSQGNLNQTIRRIDNTTQEIEKLI